MRLPAHLSLRGITDALPPWKIYMAHVRENWAVYLLGVFSVFLTNITEVAIPKIIQFIVDSLSQKKEIHLSLNQWILALLAVLSVQAIGRIFWRLALGQQTHQIGARLKSLIWDKVRFLPQRRLESDLSQGAIMNVATADVNSARFIFGFTLVGTTDFFFLLIFTSIAMLTINVELTLYCLAILPILPIFLDRLARRESRLHGAAQESLSELTDMCSQAVATIRLQKITNTTDFWREKLLEAARRYRTKRFEVVKTDYAFIPVTGIGPIVSYAVLLGLGLSKLENGTLSLGAFVAFQSYIFIIQGPLIELGVLISEWQRGFTSLKRVSDLVSQEEVPTLRTGGVEIPQANSPLFEVSNLSFSFPKSDRTIIDKLSLQIAQGERVGIKGPIGAGKSTLLQILAGLERDFQGDVKLCGRDIREYQHTSLRHKLGFVPQKPFLFADTIRNNIRLNLDISDQDIWHALNLAGLSDDVAGFPQKLDTRLGEWGINLSGGQKQRMTLARALAARPEVIFFDDCLSAVDTQTEEQILRRLDEHFKNETLIWVAHRASTLKHCSRILELTP